MSGISLDLTIERVLADPMIKAVMRADRIEPHDLAETLRAAARRFRGTRDSAAPPGEAASAGPDAGWAARARRPFGEFCFACA